MKTLYLTNGCGMYVDVENNTADKANSEIERISRIYLISEPTHIVFGEGEYSRELDAKKDDIVIVFYDRGDFKEQIVIAKSKDWVANIKAYNKAEQERKEEWAAKQKCNEPCESCDCCDMCELRKG